MHRMASCSGAELARMRQRQVRAHEKIAAQCIGISRSWTAHFRDVHDGVKDLRKDSKVAFLAVLLEAMDWPDIKICRCLLAGFPLVGDLSEQDSCLVRVKEGELKAAEMKLFLAAFSSTCSHDENVQRLDECEQALIASAREAERGNGSNDAALLRGVMDSTQE
jgi:hypothetical protein